MAGQMIIFEWTPERMETLAELWKEGLTTREIGNRLGITKNAVVGKSHRLGLPRRIPAAAPARETEAGIISLESLAVGMCRWPSGDPGTEAFRFCGKKAQPDKPYCPDHCAQAYVKSTKEAKRSVAA